MEDVRFLCRATFTNCTPRARTLSFDVAPSTRVVEYLIRKGRIPASKMALTVGDHHFPALDDKPDVLEPPPQVVTTPCDPWPRPYYLEGNLRRVLPYHFTYNTYCKERWRGREILDIFASEFRDRPLDYYVRDRPWPGQRREIFATC